MVTSGAVELREEVRQRAAAVVFASETTPRARQSRQGAPNGSAATPDPPDFPGARPAVEVGWISFDRLARSSPRPERLREVLVNEQRRGRIERDGDRWRIVAEAFPPDLLAALETLRRFRF